MHWTRDAILVYILSTFRPQSVRHRLLHESFKHYGGTVFHLTQGGRMSNW